MSNSVNHLTDYRLLGLNSSCNFVTHKSSCVHTLCTYLCTHLYLYIIFFTSHSWGPRVQSLVTKTVKNLPAIQETWVQSLHWEDPLKKRKSTHSSILAWRISWTEEPGAAVHGIAKSQTRLSDQHTHTHTHTEGTKILQDMHHGQKNIKKNSNQVQDS